MRNPDPDVYASSPTPFTGCAEKSWFAPRRNWAFVIGETITAMLTIPAYPLWALTVVAIDFMVIYGLSVYGGRPELAQ